MTEEDGPNTRYASYLLRLRLMGDRNQASWIASVENTATGHCRSFPSIEALTAFLLAEFKGRCLVSKNDSQGGSLQKSQQEE